MAYRNGTYVAFHAEGTSDPTASDIKYYNTLKMWKIRDETDFTFINSHEKRNVRDSSSRETLRRVLMERMKNSKNLLLIISEKTRLDTDWVPFEIAYAVDVCKIPIIAVYPGYKSILSPVSLSNIWPQALLDRINDESARVIHVAFKERPISAALNQFDYNNLPSTSLSYYTREVHQNWGLL